MVVVMRAIVSRVVAVGGGMGLHMHLTEHRREIVLEDMRKDLGRDASGRIVEMQGPAQACHPVAERTDRAITIASTGDGADIVADNQKGQPGILVEVFEHLGKLLLPGGVNPDGWLIQHEDARLNGQRTREEHALKLSAAERAYRTIRQILQADAFDGAIDRVAHFGRETLPWFEADRCGHGDRLADAQRERTLGFAALGDIANEATAASLLGGGTEYADGSLTGLDFTEQEFQQGGLAASVWPDDGESLARLNTEADTL